MKCKFTKKCQGQASQTIPSQSRDTQGQETFLAPSADEQTRNYDTECSNHHPSQSPQGTGIELQQDKMVIYITIYIEIYQEMPVRLSHPRSRDSQDQKTFLAPSAMTSIRSIKPPTTIKPASLKPQAGRDRDTNLKSYDQKFRK